MKMNDSQFTSLAPHYDELMQVVPYDAWVDYVLLLFSTVEHDAKKLLDCACGTGNVSFELAKCEIEVTGVDIAPDMIEVAQQKARDLGSSIRFFEADLASFDLGEKFDSATCLYDSLNYILEPETLRAAFGRIAAHLESGGVFVFDMNSDFALTTDLFTQSNLDPQKMLHYDWQATYDAKSRITSVAMRFERREADGGTSIFTEIHRERAYLLEEVREMLLSTGWEILKIYDAYTLNLPHKASERWFFVARKMK
ncbi:Methyltransferase domain-containing protein [Abditibacterium utsteinense]|uniref:Methyltransferase domain-containing protein n=2 Tax=Abditibacterium utsteinense TaxID=1960156 RepID=A0A2S8SX16_9BACT|nr:Methyltransferase domain-containing protein [Abditibacterium utsteinense]